MRGCRRAVITSRAIAFRTSAAAALAGLRHDYRLVAIDGWPIETLGVYCAVMEVDPARSVDETLARVKADPRVQLAQPMQLFSVHGGYDDPYFSQQYGAGSMQLLQMHQQATGRGIRVALIDTGVDRTHPDLKGRIGIARNFVADDARFDTDIHGTAVAGIIAADANNATGIVGIAPDADLLALKACWQGARDDIRAQCNTFTLAKALTFAIDQHADVINMSLGGPNDPLLALLIEVALARDIAVVAARESADEFPANLHGVIAVRAAGRRRGRPFGDLRRRARSVEYQSRRALRLLFRQFDGRRARRRTHGIAAAGGRASHPPPTSCATSTGGWLRSATRNRRLRASSRTTRRRNRIGAAGARSAHGHRARRRRQLRLPMPPADTPPIAIHAPARRLWTRTQRSPRQYVYRGVALRDRPTTSFAVSTHAGGWFVDLWNGLVDDARYETARTTTPHRTTASGTSTPAQATAPLGDDWQWSLAGARIVNIGEQAFKRLHRVAGQSLLSRRAARAARVFGRLPAARLVVLECRSQRIPSADGLPKGRMGAGHSHGAGRSNADYQYGWLGLSGFWLRTHWDARWVDAGSGARYVADSNAGGSRVVVSLSWALQLLP